MADVALLVRGGTVVDRTGRRQADVAVAPTAPSQPSLPTS
jgi:hypothetical protein